MVLDWHQYRDDDEGVHSMNDRLILAGRNGSDTGYMFSPLRAFSTPGEARTYERITREANPYTEPIVYRWLPLGLSASAETEHDNGVALDVLLGEAPDTSTEEALAALRAKLEAPVDPWLAHATCAENAGKGECALPMRTDHDGKARCAVHTHDATHCANYAQGFGACFGPVHADGDNGELLCEKHSNDENKEK